MTIERYHPRALQPSDTVGDVLATLDDGTVGWRTGGSVYAQQSTLTAVGGETTLSLAATPIAESLWVSVNGTVLDAEDFSVAGTTATFAVALTAGDKIHDYYQTETPNPAASTLGTPATLADLPATAYAAHRGGGLLAPESTMTAFQRAVDDGADALEFDVWATSDGVAVVMHDAAVDRTTDGTGRVDSLTAAQIAALAVDSATWFGSAVYGNGTVPTLDDVLDAFGGQVVLFPQAQNTAVNTALIDAVTSRGLVDSVCVQVSNPTDAAPFVTAGLHVGVVIGNNTDAASTHSPANCTAAGVEWVFINGSASAPVSDANVTAYLNAGLKVLMHSVIRHYRRDHYTALGVDGFMVDDVKYLEGSGYQLAADPFTDQTFWHGHYTADILTGADDVTATSRGAWSAPDKWGVPTPGTTFVGALQGWAEIDNPAGSYTLTTDITFETLGSSSTRWAAVKFCATQDQPYNETNPPPAGEDGYAALIRQNGTLDLYKRVGGSGSNPTLLATLATAALTAGQTATLQIDVTPTGITVTRTDVGGTNSVASSDTTYRGPYVYYGRSGTATAQGPAVWFSHGTKVEV